MTRSWGMGGCFVSDKVRSFVGNDLVFRVVSRMAILWTAAGCLLLLSTLPVQAEESSALPLTAEERSWIDRNSAKLALWFNTEFPPVEFAAPDGTFVGIGADVIALIEKQIGITFPKSPCVDWNKHLAALKSGECAIAPTIVPTTERKAYAYFTTPYATVPVVIIGPRDSGRGLTLDSFVGKKVAVVAGYATEKYLQDNAGDRLTIFPVKNVPEGLRAVSFGQVDAYVENLAVAAYYIDREGVPNLQVVGSTDYSFAWSIGISRKYPLLYSIIQKALDAIPADELDAVRKHWISLQVHSGMSQETIRLIQVAGVFAVLLVLGLVGITYFLRLKLKEKMKTLQTSQQKLLEQAELLQLAMEETQAAVWESQPIDLTIYLSPQWYAMLGYATRNKRIPLAELRGFLHPDDVPEMDRNMQEYIAGGGQDRFEAEYRLLRSDGTWCWVLSKARAVAWDKQGKPTRIIGLDINIQKIKETQARLAQSEAKFRAVFDYAPYAISINSLDGRYLDVNPALLKSRGITKAELLRHKARDFAQVSDEEEARIIQALRETGSITNLEAKVQKQDGSIAHALYSCALVDIQGEKQILSMVVDVTELKQAERALRESEARFRSLFQMAPLPLVEASRDGRVLAVNNRLQEVLGYSLEDVPTIDDWWQKAYPDLEYRKQVMEDWQTALAEAEKGDRDVRSGEYRITGKDGTERTMIIGASMIGDSLLISFSDITERKQQETAILENIELLRATLNATPDGILVVNQGLKVIQANQQFYKMWRIPEELQKTDDDNALRAYVQEQLADPESFQNMVANLYQSRKQDKYEIAFKDGRVFECYTAPMVRDGRETGRVWDFQDISERKWAEAERENLQGQLLQAQKLKAVGILAGGVAHDFNNMLGAIIGYSELTMEMMDADNRFRKNLSKILDAAHRSAGLTRQLLTFARKQAVTPMIFDLNASVEATLKMLRRLIGENIDLVWQPAGGKCRVCMDPTQLDQILANLCVNARDAIADVGKVTIQVQTATFDDASCKPYLDCIPGNYVQLTVSDTGSGMEPETVAHIFEPFFTTKGVGQGTGLGLATVYGIVRQNNGFVYVYSEPGMGTTFKIFIPQHLDVEAEQQSETEDSIPYSRGETVLMVEDDPILLEMGSMMLQRLGYEVLPAGSPNEAIRLIEEGNREVHMFITDVIMPEMNGRDLADRILALRPGLKYLFMSGYTADVITEQGVMDEGSLFIQKPFSVKDIAVKIRAMLDSR